MRTHIVSGRSGWMKVGWLERPPHAPNTVDMFTKKGLCSDRVNMELTVIGDFKMGHFGEWQSKRCGK